jgi:formylglycine-generating enzyme required for sulfatase activity
MRLALFSLLTIHALAGWVFAADIPPGPPISPERIEAAQPIVVASISSQPSAMEKASLLDTTKDVPFVNTLGMKFIHVPGTNVLFSVWDTRAQDYAAYARDNKVDDTWTREKKANVPISLEPECPVVGVSWDDAQAFCKWLTEKDEAAASLPPGAIYRLPTDEEWSRAVGLESEQGATPEAKSGRDQVNFPWGLNFPPKEKVGNYADEAFHAVFSSKRDRGDLVNAWIKGYTDGFDTTSPVGSFPANAFGLYDMGGNVWQWCEDWFGAPHKDRTLRGASWDYSDRKFLLSSHRIHSAPTTRSFSHGFRCVVDVSGRSARQ